MDCDAGLMVFLNSVYNIVIVLGIVCNTFCIAILTKIVVRERINGHMFRYLLAKAICDLTFFCCNFFEIFYFQCEACITAYSFLLELWYVWSYYYIEEIVLLLSLILEIAATVDCYLMITNKWQYCFQRKICFWIVLCTSITFCALYYTCYPIFITINAFPIANSTQMFYNHTWSNSIILISFDLSQSILRDFLSLILLVILNGLILNSLRRTTANRRCLGRQDNQQASAQLSVLVLKATAAERRKVLMIVASGLNIFLGHFFFIISNLWYWIDKESIWICADLFSETFLNASYVTPIFFYLAFNSTFLRYSLRIFRICGARNNAS